MKARTIYVVGFDGFAKVGQTTNLKVRMNALQSGNPHRIRIAYSQFVDPIWAVKLERNCLCALRKHRVRGEWFSVEPERAAEVVALAVAETLAEIAGLTAEHATWRESLSGKLLRRPDAA